MKFTEDYFTDDELTLLRMAFKLLDTSVESMYKLDYTNYSTDVFHLKCKLGIDDLVDI